MRRCSLVLPFLALLALSCNNNGGGETPTSPAAGSTKLNFVVVTTSSHTLRKVNLTFDGHIVAAADEPSGAGQVQLQATVDAGPGSHTIRVIIVDQASSPNPYSAGGSISTPLKILDLAQVQGVLQTGEALEFRVTL